MTEQEVDEIIKPFSEQRTEIRREWNRVCQRTGHVNWDLYLEQKAKEIKNVGLK